MTAIIVAALGVVLNIMVLSLAIWVSPYSMKALDFNYKAMVRILVPYLVVGFGIYEFLNYLFEKIKGSNGNT